MHAIAFEIATGLELLAKIANSYEGEEEFAPLICTLKHNHQRVGISRLHNPSTSSPIQCAFFFGNPI